MVTLAIRGEVREESHARADAAIASDDAWREACRWAGETCIPADFVDLRELTDHGVCGSAVGLLGELNNALALNPPPGVCDVIHAMIEALNTAGVGGDDFAFVGSDRDHDDATDEGGELLAAAWLEPELGGES